MRDPAQPPVFRVLAISGSLRAASSNTAALGALRVLAPPDMTVTLYEGLRKLPPFDPDADGPRPPRAVLALRSAVAAADAIVISSPEYARGVAGSLKNALDWLVSGPEFPGKRVALVNTSPRAVDAQAALRLTLETMAGAVVDTACITLPLLGRGLDTAGIVADPVLAEALRGSLAALAATKLGAGIERPLGQP